jgi:hypothetical protein
MLLSNAEKYLSAAIPDLFYAEYLVAVFRLEAYVKYCPSYARAIANQIIHKKSPLYFRKTKLTLACFSKSLMALYYLFARSGLYPLVKDQVELNL